MDVVALAAAKADAKKYRAKGVTTVAPWYATSQLAFAVRGIDKTDDRLFAIDNGNLLVMSTDGGATWSGSKGLPTNVDGSKVTRIYRWGGYIYLVGYDTVATTVNLYRAAPAPVLNDAFVWSASLLTLTAGSNSTFAMQISGSSWGDARDALIVQDYGPDPTGGPSMWRSTDGTTWTKVLGPISATRHFHHVKWDEYAPGVWWMTCGDGTGHEFYRSTDYGVTWTKLSTSSGSTADLSGSQWQAVTIVPTADAVYFAGDSGYFTNFKMWRTDIANGTFQPVICPTYHQHLPITNGARPARGAFTDGVLTSGSKVLTSATAAFTSADVGRVIAFNASFNPGGFPGVMRFWIAAVTNSTTVTLNAQANASASSVTFTISEELLWHGAFYMDIDQSTGIIYQLANDATSSGGRAGFFCTFPDGHQVLLESWGPAYSFAVFVYNGYVYAGRMKRALLAVADWSRP